MIVDSGGNYDRSTREEMIMINVNEGHSFIPNPFNQTFFKPRPKRAQAKAVSVSFTVVLRLIDSVIQNNLSSSIFLLMAAKTLSYFKK